LLVDLYLVYQFLRRLTTPFEDWDAYKLGVINADGNILKKKDQRKTQEEKDSLRTYDLMILKLKKLLAKVPGGSSKLASYAAALWLIREWNHFSDSSTLTEDISEDVLDESTELFYDMYINYTILSEDVNKKIKEDGAIGMSAGSGAVAGLGVGPQGEPGLTRAQQKKHRTRAAATFNSDPLKRRKTFSDFLKDDLTVPNITVADTVVGEPGTGDTAGSGYRPKKRYNKHTRTVAAQ
jgi:hypothetical protein